MQQDARAKLVSHSHNFHRRGSAKAEKSQITVFIRKPRGLSRVHKSANLAIRLFENVSEHAK